MTSKKNATEETTEPTSTPPNWKIPPTKVASDDCDIYVGRVIEDGEITQEGTPYYVHEGEWVDLIPCRSLAEVMALSDIGASAQSGSGALRELCQVLSERIVAWNWTDMATEPLPQPHNTPAVLERLTDDELMWLLSAAQGKETTAARKNA